MDFFPLNSGPLEHTPPLFYKLNLLNIFDIYKFQLGKLVFDSLNNIGPSEESLILQEPLKFIAIQPDPLCVATCMLTLSEHPGLVGIYGLPYLLTYKKFQPNRHLINILRLT